MLMKNGMVKHILMGVLCGVLTYLLNFALIRSFFMTGIPDFLWIGAMLLLPIVPATALLRTAKVKPWAVFVGLAAQILLILLFGGLDSTVAGIFGGLSELEAIGQTLNSILISLGATLVQFVALVIANKIG